MESPDLTPDLTLEWRAPFVLDLSRTLGVHQRGRGDPAFRVTPDGFMWRTALTPDGPGTLRVAPARPAPASGTVAGSSSGTVAGSTSGTVSSSSGTVGSSSGTVGSSSGTVGSCSGTVRGSTSGSVAGSSSGTVRGST
ncbi:MAG: hypothetical protein ACLP5E_20450, partial [Streptosporangiaceae bacterium]